MQSAKIFETRGGALGELGGGEILAVGKSLLGLGEILVRPGGNPTLPNIEYSFRGQEIESLQM